MFRIAFLLTITFFIVTKSFGQITIRVVAVDSVASEIDSLSIPDFLIDEGFTLRTGRFFWTSSLQMPRPIRTENVSFKVKNYSKLKTFEIILQDFNTIERSLDFYNQYSEFKHLKKYRMIYEGDSIVEHKELLKSISKQAIKEKKGLDEIYRRNGNRYNNRKYKPSVTPLISEYYLEENKDSDNFLLNIIFKGEKFSFPVALALESNSAKKIQKTYGKFYTTYSDLMEARKSSWNLNEDQYKAYLDTFSIIPLTAQYLTEDGKRIDPSFIYTVNYTSYFVQTSLNTEGVYIDAEDDISIVILDNENNVGFVEVSKFKEIQENSGRGQLIFEMKPLTEQPLGELLNLDK